MDSNYYYGSADAGEQALVGMKRGHDHEPSEGKLDAAVMEKRYRYDDSEDTRWKRIAVYAPLAGTKRGYEQPEDDIEAMLVDKRYKGDFWEDPARARLVQLYGGRKAKQAAQINQAYRVMKETDAWLASVAARQKLTPQSD
jgi:hypothetical protein